KFGLPEAPGAGLAAIEQPGAEERAAPVERNLDAFDLPSPAGDRIATSEHSRASHDGPCAGLTDDRVDRGLTEREAVLRGSLGSHAGGVQPVGTGLEVVGRRLALNRQRGQPLDAACADV